MISTDESRHGELRRISKTAMIRMVDRHLGHVLIILTRHKHSIVPYQVSPAMLECVGMTVCIPYSRIYCIVE